MSAERSQLQFVVVSSSKVVVEGRDEWKTRITVNILYTVIRFVGGGEQRLFSDGLI